MFVYNLDRELTVGTPDFSVLRLGGVFRLRGDRPRHGVPRGLPLVRASPAEVPRHRLILLPIGAVTIWAFNAFRLAALVTIGAWGAPKLAVEGLPLAGGLDRIHLSSRLGSRPSAHARMSSGRSKKSMRPKRRPTKSRRINPVSPYLLPQLAIVAASMIGGARCRLATDSTAAIRSG